MLKFSLINNLNLKSKVLLFKNKNFTNFELYKFYRLSYITAVISFHKVTNISATDYTFNLLKVKRTPFLLKKEFVAGSNDFSLIEGSVLGESKELEPTLDVGLLEYIRLEIRQQTFKNYYMQLFDKKNKTVRFWSKKQISNVFIFRIFQSLFISAYTMIYRVTLILQYTANNQQYLHSFNKILSPYIQTLLNLQLKFTFFIIISKPNFFFINFQKKKFGSIKKSRKKLMYLFLNSQKPKVPKMFNTSNFLIILINFVIVTFLFWVITLLELSLNKSTDNPIKTDVYECGFFTINKNVFPVTLNTIILLFFVIIYEVEFILAVPLFLNLKIGVSFVLWYVSAIFFIVILTLYLDIWLKKIYWLY